jgi:hypothetical protein
VLSVGANTAGLIQGVLPGLALRIFLKLVPKLLRMLQHWQGAPSISEREFHVEQKYYIFQVCSSSYLVTSL